MRYTLIILLSSITSLCFCQSGAETEDIQESNTLQLENQTATFELNQQLESLVLDYEIARTSSFNNGLKIITDDSFNSMESITNDVLELDQNSYAGTYLQYKREGFTESGLSYLKLAEAKTENKSELISDFLALAHVLKKNDLLEKYSERLRNSGFISSSVLEYNKNILRSLSETDAILITNGWDDTYPLLTLLNEEKKKTIQVVNIEWLYDQNYRMELSAELGKTPLPFTSPYSWINSMTENTAKPIYYAPSIPNDELIKLQNKLSPVGLVLRKSPITGNDQKSLNLSAWNRFSKLTMSSSEPLNKNYIIMLTLLENLLDNDANEKGTLAQISSVKKALIKQHPSLK